MDIGCVSSGIPETVTTSELGTTIVKGHKWFNSWPGNFCLRCGSEQVLELALAENWQDFEDGPDEETPGSPVWKSEDHKALVDLCDDFCYADMTASEAEEHKAKIKVLCDKVGYRIRPE
jgi:hypothetical protein